MKRSVIRDPVSARGESVFVAHGVPDFAALHPYREEAFDAVYSFVLPLVLSGSVARILDAAVMAIDTSHYNA
jgi:hypothetical protein